MHARYKKYVAIMAVVPVVASLGLTSAAPSTAAGNRQQVMKNGNFEKGRSGWVVGSPRTKAVVVKQGLRGSKAVRLSKARTGPAILSSRSNVARSAKAGARYTVSAYVRTNQPGVRGRLVLRESANGRTVKMTGKAFKATRAWRRVALNASTRRAGTQLNVRIAFPRLAKRKVILIDNVSVARWVNGSNAPHAPRPAKSHIVGKMTNGCAYDNRGIPDNCGAYFGSAYGSNSDPKPWENQMNQQLGIRRTYWGASQVSKAVSVAKADLAQHRLPWISFKLPHGWADMASGKGDAWARDIAVKLNQLNGPVWLAFHHEPEGDGDIKQWTAMQARLAPIVRGHADNVAFSIVVTGWNQLYGEKQYSLDSLWPKNTKVDLLGVDTYEKLGVVKNGKDADQRDRLAG